MVLINLERERAITLSCYNSYQPTSTPLKYALDFLKRTRGTFGIIVQPNNGQIQCELFAVLFDDEPGDSNLHERALKLAEVVESWRVEDEN